MPNTYRKMNNNKSLISFKNFRPTGIFTGILIGIAVAFAFQAMSSRSVLSSSLLAPGGSGGDAVICGLTQMPVSNSTTGIISNETDYTVATAAYKLAHPNNVPGVTWGGSIGKNHLIAIINSLGNDATEVHFKFITNTDNSKTGLFFEGGMFNAVTGVHGTSKLYIRTCTASDAFCPPRCQ